MMCAPPDVSCIRGVNAGRMVFGVRACGDWSKAVNRWAWTAAGVTTNDGTVDVDDECTGRVDFGARS